MLLNQCLGVRIKYFRNKMGYTQKQLGEMVGINDSTIRNYELGNRMPDINKLKEISHALEVDIYALMLPDATNVHGAIHSLFRLEELFGFTPEKHGDKTVIALDQENQTSFFHENTKLLKEMETALYCWCQAKQSLIDGSIDEEMYQTWKSKFPVFSTIGLDGTPIILAEEEVKKKTAEEQLKNDYEIYLAAKNWAGESDILSLEEFAKKHK